MTVKSASSRVCRSSSGRARASCASKVPPEKPATAMCANRAPARMGKAPAVAAPKRIEVLELLAQGERTVDALARATGMGVTNTSAHLQLLRHARLVDTRKDGTSVFYRLVGDEVAVFIAVLRDLARSRLAEVDQVVRDYFGARDALEPVSRPELVERAERGDVVILDVRPPGEFAAGHIPAALSVPLDCLDDALARLPRGAQ